jgi:hypothetical protein
MQSSSFKTISVPGAATPGTQPIRVAQAPHDRPVRVEMRNVGAVQLFFAESAADAINYQSPSMNTYRLAPGDPAVLIVAPKQKLFCVGATPGGRVTISVSEAFPLKTP